MNKRQRKKAIRKTCIIKHVITGKKIMIVFPYPGRKEIHYIMLHNHKKIIKVIDKKNYLLENK